MSIVSHGLFELPQPKRISLSESVADTIAEAISTRIIMPGERIVETALVEKLGVSRVPIREALKVLHAQGILNGGGHRGYRVSAFDPGTTQQVMEVRLSLESFLLRDAIENWRSGVEDIAALQRPIDDMKASARAGDIRASLIADLDFHRAIRVAARNPVVGTLWDTIARHVLIVFNFDRYRDENLDAIPKQHEEFRAQIQEQVARSTTKLDELYGALEDHMLLIERKKRRKLAIGI
ncbi:DNA-binding transcriptional regulator, GntR family [Devosia sp. YR412]|uniref:GntR family transcriptional regulator n=1 Tax=Devosia sp. YR412 TaxID=1881030 RepID=UPI0008AFBF72|nr:GntR family transcriptional regulator [Devosia sp. YR412]SEQ41095.1 DNA-binding transcriptional regulator, GntR family [Devosia sp. YR412]